MERILIVGSSGSGKSTLAVKLGDRLQIPVYDLDHLHWGPNWTPKPKEVFHAGVQQAIASPRWIIAGNYTALREMLWPHATTVIWLNYSFPRVFSRLFYRSVSRMITREELFAGNRESFRLTFCSRDSVLVWMLKTFRRNRREYAQLRADQTYPQLEWIEFRAPRQATMLLD
ncbi:MAG: hypothetical protein U0903_05120 [Planctomycetales bacterium]